MSLREPVEATPPDQTTLQATSASASGPASLPGS